MIQKTPKYKRHLQNLQVEQKIHHLLHQAGRVSLAAQDQEQPPVQF